MTVDPNEQSPIELADLESMVTEIGATFPLMAYAAEADGDQLQCIVRQALTADVAHGDHVMYVPSQWRAKVVRDVVVQE